MDERPKSATVVPRSSSLLLALGAALTPVAACALTLLCAPVFDWWWTPGARALVFALVLDVLLLAGSVVAGVVTSGSKASKVATTRATAAYLAASFLVAAAITWRWTRPTCVQLYDAGDHYLATGESGRAQECFEEARRLCLAAGHSPAH